MVVFALLILLVLRPTVLFPQLYGIWHRLDFLPSLLPFDFFAVN